MMEVSATKRRTPALTTDSREDVRRECEKLGELVVQARLESDHFGTGKAFAWEWLLEQYCGRRRAVRCAMDDGGRSFRRRRSDSFAGEILVSVANPACLRQTCCFPRTI